VPYQKVRSRGGGKDRGRESWICVCHDPKKKKEKKEKKEKKKKKRRKVHSLLPLLYSDFLPSQGK
jgi:hypothetical protein